MGKNVIISTLPNISQNYLPKVNTSNIFANSLVYDDGSSVLINTTTASAYKLDVNGTGRFQGALSGTSATFSGFIGINGAAATYPLTVNGSNSTAANNTITGATADLYALAIRQKGANAGIGGSNFMAQIISAAGAEGLEIYTPNSKELILGTNATARLTISSTGAATFSSSVTANGNLNLQGAVTRNINFLDSSNTNINAQIQYDQISSNSGQLFFGTNNAGSFATRLTIASTGAATFSSSVTATGTITMNKTGGYGFLAQDDGNNTAANGAYIGFTNNAANRYFIQQLDTSNNIRYHYFNGSVWSPNIIQFSNVGGATFGGVLTVNNSAAIVNYTTGHSLFVGGNAINGVSNGIILLQSGRIPQSGSDTTGTNGLLFQHTISGGTIVNGGYIYNIRETVFGATSDVNTALVFATTNANTNTERMRITSLGYLKGSNTGNYISASDPYHEFSSNRVNYPVLYVQGNSVDFGDNILSLQCARTTTNNTYYALSFYNSSTVKFRVADSGNVTNANNSYGQISDIKLKENIVDATPKLNDLLKVKIKNFNFIGDDKKQIGVIAQELEEIFPGLIEEAPDVEERNVPKLDENGDEILDENYEVIMVKEKIDLGTKTKSVKYSVFIPILIKAIQEQQEQIEELKALINK